MRLLYSSNAAADLQEARSQRQEEYEIGCCRARARCQPQVKFNLVIYSEQRRRTFAGKTKSLGHVTSQVLPYTWDTEPNVTLKYALPAVHKQSAHSSLDAHNSPLAKLY